MKRVGRNDPCPCGSGKKFKKCCLPATPISHTELDLARKTRAEAFKDMAEEKWEIALNKFSSIRDDLQDPFPIRWAVAACYDGLEDYLRAAEHFEKALEICPEKHRLDLTYQLGVARGCANRMEKASEAFRQCLDLGPSRERREQLNRLIGTVEAVTKGEEPPGLFRFIVQMQRAFTDMEEKRFESAAGRLERLNADEPDNPVITYNLGVVYTFLKKEKEALAQFEKTVEQRPDYVEAWYNMGQISLIKFRDYSRALHCFDRAATIRPDYIGAQHQRGVAWEMLGDTEKALECWNRTLELDPENKPARESIQRIERLRDQTSDHLEGKDTTG
jgi:tetratricopeptide (TPR) repeat protein